MTENNPQFLPGSSEAQYCQIVEKARAESRGCEIRMELEIREQLGTISSDESARLKELRQRD